MDRERNGERIRRPELDRSHPRRSFAGAPATRASGDQEGGFVEEGVRAAYAVMDAYLRQGRRVARKIGRLSPPSFRAGDWRDRQARFVELTGELVANWFDLLGLVSEGLYSLGEAVEPSPAVQVAYEIDSARPALVALEFLPGAATTRVTSPSLQSLDPRATPIGVDFEARDDRHLIVRVRVTAAQVPGLYNGVLLAAESGRAVGTMSLELR